jgi:hypothetical protein
VKLTTMKKLSILLAILMLATAAAAQRDYRTYSNARYAYSVRYPADLLAPQGEADNGDGQVFTGEGAEMRVYGSHLLVGETLLKEFNAAVAGYGDGVAYRAYRPQFFVVSARRDGKIHYRKTVARPDGAFVTFQIVYDETKHGVYDRVVEKIAKSFK